VTHSPDPEPSLSPDLPIKLKCAIGECITLFSEIESCIVEIVWLLKQADLPTRKKIAKELATGNIRVVKKAFKSIPGARSDEIWAALEEVRNDRNLIGHGVWRMSDGLPFVVSVKFRESADGVTGEYFDWPRFDCFLQRGRLLLKTFAEFKAGFEAAIAEEKAHRTAAQKSE
jgi:hypothetical protein